MQSEQGGGKKKKKKTSGEKEKGWNGEEDEQGRNRGSTGSPAMCSTFMKCPHFLFSTCWRLWQPFLSLLNLWKFPFAFSLSLPPHRACSSLPWQWCYSESPPDFPPPQHHQDGTWERARERQRDIYRGERGRERETEEEKGLCFPGNRLGVSPTPIGSQLVGISLLPTIVGANTFSVSRFSLSLLFLLCLFIRMHT